MTPDPLCSFLDFWRASTQARVHTGSVRPLQGHCPRTHTWCQCHPRSISCDIYVLWGLSICHLSERFWKQGTPNDWRWNELHPEFLDKPTWHGHAWPSKSKEKGVRSQFWHRAHCPMPKRQSRAAQLSLERMIIMAQQQQTAADSFVSKSWFIPSSQRGKWGVKTFKLYTMGFLDGYGMILAALIFKIIGSSQAKGLQHF